MDDPDEWNMHIYSPENYDGKPFDLPTVAVVIGVFLVGIALAFVALVRLG